MPTLVLRLARLLLLAVAVATQVPVRAGLELAVFDADATPSPGTLLAYNPMTAAGELTLRARGVVLTGAGQPIVLCALDWIGIANASHDEFRDLLANAAGTTRERVALHTLHQHDAPWADVTAGRILKDLGYPEGVFDPAIVRPAMLRTVAAVQASLTNRQPVTAVGWGRAEVFQVASNRRIPYPDGRIRGVRYTACTDPDLRAAPEGTIDPFITVVSFWNGPKPIAALSHYATHPQSYYLTGIANPDFPGIARFLADQAHPGLPHIHFNGAGGNIGAGKYNDGAKTNRAVLAGRLADALERAWQSTRQQPLAVTDVGWAVEAVRLPTAPHLTVEGIKAKLGRPGPLLYIQAAELAWLERQAAGHTFDIGCLRLGTVRLLHLPGELFVEYQLAAQAMRPDLHVALAAYGDYAPAYIGTEIAYPQGGYETSADASFVAPSVQPVLMGAISRLLGAGSPP
jgi:hypothetical protein